MIFSCRIHSCNDDDDDDDDIKSIKSLSGYNGVLITKVMSPASVSVQNINQPINRSPQRAFQVPYPHYPKSKN